MARLSGKVALLSGGGSGLGGACAEAMAAEGARVVIADQDQIAGEALAQSIGTAARFMAHDALSEESWNHVYASVARIEGQLDILVNCVGAILIDPIDASSLERWRRCLALNLDTVFLGCNLGIPIMRKSGGGSIINFSSTMGKRARGESVAYSTAKAGITMMTRSIAVRCGEVGYNIRCNAISPGTVMTAMTEATLAGLVASGTAASHDDAVAMITATRPLRRLGEPREVADVAVFLASDESSYVTGVDIAVDGGFIAS